MASNYARLWVQSADNQKAVTQAKLAIEATGRALPCTVSAVSEPFVTLTIEATMTVTINGQAQPLNFPPLTIPVAESAYFRVPIQVGDKGVTLPASTTLAGLSGQGSGTADLDVDYGNLGSTLVFVPISTTSFSSMPDANKAWANGPNGAIIGSSDGTIQATFDKGANAVTILVPAGAKILLGSASVGDAAHQVMTAEDVQNAINAYADGSLLTWLNANFQSGTGTASAPPAITVTGSSTVFAKE